MASRGRQVRFPWKAKRNLDNMNKNKTLDIRSVYRGHPASFVWISHQSFPFPWLPAELRNRIYGILANSDWAVRKRRNCNRNRNMPRPYQSRGVRALTQVCRQTRGEFGPIYMRCICFNIRLHDLMGFQNAWFPGARRLQAGSPHHITLIITLDIFSGGIVDMRPYFLILAATSQWALHHHYEYCTFDDAGAAREATRFKSYTNIIIALGAARLVSEDFLVDIQSGFLSGVGLTYDARGNIVWFLTITKAGATATNPQNPLTIEEMRRVSAYCEGLAVVRYTRIVVDIKDGNGSIVRRTIGTMAPTCNDQGWTLAGSWQGA